MSVIMMDFKNHKRIDDLRDAHRQADKTENERRLENKAVFTGFIAGALVTLAIAVSFNEYPKIESNWKIIQHNEAVESRSGRAYSSDSNNQEYLLNMLSALHSSNVASGNWAGYEVESAPGAFNGIYATFTVPEVTWHGSKAIDTWAGLGGRPAEGLIQAGVSAAGGYVRPWIETLPKATVFIHGMHVKQGDVISISIKNKEKDGRGTSWDISIVDNTNGKVFSENVNYKAAAYSAECMVESPRSDMKLNSQVLENLPEFGTIRFSACRPELTRQGIDEATRTVGGKSDSMKTLFMSILRSDDRFATKITNINKGGHFNVTYVNDGPFMLTAYRSIN